MSTSLSQTVLSPWLTPVRLVSTSNVSGTYFNGPNNNGVGATLTISASSLTVDSVVAAVGDRILLQTQTSTLQQGIYIVLSIGSTVVLQRAADLQNIEQFKAGLYVSVGAGSVNAGNIFALVEPLPSNIGVDAIVFDSNPTAGTVTFSGPASTANALAVFSDTSGNLKAQSTTSTLGFGLTAATGNIVATSGNLVAGSSGAAGTVGSFPSAATSGELLLAAVTNSGGNFNTTISNASSVGQSQVVSIPDSGAATANFILSANAGTQHITAGALQVDAGAVSSGLAAGGFVGLFKAFSTTANKGFIALQGANNATGNFGTTLSNQTAQAQAQVLTFPDVSAATGNVLAAGAALVSGNLVQASGTSGAVVDSAITGASVSGAITQLGKLYQVSVTLTPSQMANAYATPQTLVANPLASQMILILQATVYTASTGNTPYATGTAPIIQYSSGGTNGAHGAGTIATAAGLVAGDITAATSQVRNLFPIATGAQTALSGLGIYFSNATGAYTAGTGTNVTFTLVYQLLTATV
jgi:hypothetical protein